MSCELEEITTSAATPAPTMAIFMEGEGEGDAPAPPAICSNITGGISMNLPCTCGTTTAATTECTTILPLCTASNDNDGVCNSIGISREPLPPAQTPTLQPVCSNV